jgi:hypothetical protein
MAAAAQPAPNAAASEVIRSLAHDINCLTDEAWGTRKRGLENLTSVLTKLSADAQKVVSLPYDKEGKG